MRRGSCKSRHQLHNNKKHNWKAEVSKSLEVNLLLLFSSQQVRKRIFARQQGTTVYEYDTKHSTDHRGLLCVCVVCVLLFSSEGLEQVSFGLIFKSTLELIPGRLICLQFFRCSEFSLDSTFVFSPLASFEKFLCHMFV